MDEKAHTPLGRVFVRSIDFVKYKKILKEEEEEKLRLISWVLLSPILDHKIVYMLLGLYFVLFYYV